MNDLETKLVAVRKEDPMGYGRRALPSPLDQLVGALIEAFIVATPMERRRVSAQSDETLSRLLLVFAERMASLAVRLNSRDHLFKGLVALAAEGWTTDSREDLLILSLLHDAAIRIGLDPREAFEQVLPYTTKPVADSLERFLARTPQDKVIEAMGYRVGADADGFRYERTW
jgi:hypothetical protein